MYVTVTQETWPGTEARDEEEATFGGLGHTERGHDPGPQGARYIEHPDPGRQEAPQQGAEPSSHPCRSRPGKAPPSADQRQLPV